MGQLNMLNIMAVASGFPLVKVAHACSNLSIDIEKTLMPQNTIIDTAKILNEIKESKVADILHQKVDELLHEIDMFKARRQ